MGESKKYYERARYGKKIINTYVDTADRPDRKKVNARMVPKIQLQSPSLDTQTKPMNKQEPSRCDTRGWSTIPAGLCCGDTRFGGQTLPWQLELQTGHVF